MTYIHKFNVNARYLVVLKLHKQGYSINGIADKLDIPVADVITIINSKTGAKQRLINED